MERQERVFGGSEREVGIEQVNWLFVQEIPLRVLYTITLFVCSALLFLVEPMVAKMILPTFGGSASVWNASMVFFQTVLLLGYLYAHLSTRFLGARHQALVHLGVMLLPLLALPIAIPAWTPEGSRNPTLLLLALLAMAVGLPFFALSAGAPLIQKWFADTNDPAAHDPYFLYRASNLGSMVGLLGYPAIYERDFTLKQQSLYWGYGYWGLLVLVGCAVALLWRSPKPAPEKVAAEEPDEAIVWKTRLRWIALAAVPSSLLLGVTTYITSNLTPIPLLWVVPLALYLLTFVIAFSNRPRWLSGTILARVFPLFVAPMMLAIILESTSYFVQLAVAHLLIFFLAALMCHSLLSESRPKAKHLTEFYLWLSVGGMLGGVFNALLAPVIFKTVAEYPIALILACLLRPLRPEVKGRALWDYAYPAIVGVVTVFIILICYARGMEPSNQRTALTIGVPIVLAFVAVDRPMRFGLALGAIVLAANWLHVNASGNVVYTQRSFFGVHRVVDIGRGMRLYVHGNTKHGIQNLTPGKERKPLTYYYPTGPIGEVFTAYSGRDAKKDVALVGLGIGSLAGYGEPGQEMTFFEIDPEVQYMARDSGLFTYLTESRAKIRIVLGDARLMLAREPEHKYGIIVLDAFSSDSIPVHLMTLEALKMYLDKLTPDGIIAYHISNRYLELQGVVANLGAKEGMFSLVNDDASRESWPAGEEDEGKYMSKWIVMAHSKAALAKIVGNPQWRPLPPEPNAPLWTDDYSNILSVFHT